MLWLRGEGGGTAFVHAFTGMEHLHSEASSQLRIRDRNGKS